MLILERSLAPGNTKASSHDNLVCVTFVVLSLFCPNTTRLCGGYMSVCVDLYGSIYTQRLAASKSIDSWIHAEIQYSDDGSLCSSRKL